MVADQRRRADRGVAGPRRLVTCGAVAVEDLLASRDKLVQVPDLVGILGSGGELFFWAASHRA